MNFEKEQTTECKPIFSRFWTSWRNSRVVNFAKSHKFVKTRNSQYLRKLLPLVRCSKIQEVEGFTETHAEGS